MIGNMDAAGLYIVEQGPGWPDGARKEIPLGPRVYEGPTVDETCLQGWRGGRGKREQEKSGFLILSKESQVWMNN